MPENSENPLFPVFLKLESLKVLVVGGGAVALEKVTAIFINSPRADVTLVAPEIRQEIVDLAGMYDGLRLIRKPYEDRDLEDKDLAIAATSLKALNLQVRTDARSRRVLINVADTPEICDFYLSSVVRKGDLKIAISTNGKSPTFAKRVRELLEEALPDGIDQVLGNLRSIREKLKGDFAYKVKKLEEITSAFKEGRGTERRQSDDKE